MIKKHLVHYTSALVFTFFLLPASLVHANPTWDKGEDPNLFLFQDEKLETDFYKLRLDAAVNEGAGHAPWSETYWPADEGGIAVRGMYDLRPGRKAFKASHPSLAELKTMSVRDLRKLSPAEKFDILNGEYNYPLTSRVLAQYEGKHPSWWGICHGWVPAAVNYPEPLTKTVTNKDGIVIEFGSSDIKGLMSYYYAWEAAQFNAQGEENWGFKTNASGKSEYWQKDPSMVYFVYRQLGERCESGGCKGKNLNPASFHLAIANLVGNYQRSFSVNVDASKQVWNQPVLSYSSEVLDTKAITENDPDSRRDTDGQEGESLASPKHPTPDAVKRVLVRTAFTYVVETGPQFAPHGTAPGAVVTEKKELVYWLELDAENHVINGYWSHGLFKKRSHNTSYIGFAWRASRVPFLGKFTVLNQLYETNAKKVVSFATSKNFTPNLEDIFFGPNQSTIPVFNWSAVNSTSVIH